MTDPVRSAAVQPYRFSHDEEEALAKDESTTTIMNRARRDAHLENDAEIPIRGDDQTYSELKEEQQHHVGSVGGGHIYGTAIEGAEIGGLLHLGAAGPISGAIGGLLLGGKHLHDEYVNGIERNQTLAKDQLHVALMTQLGLPDGYRAEAFAERSYAGNSSSGPVTQIASQFYGADQKFVATLRLHADRGMNAAVDFLDSGASRESFFKSHPRAASAYAEDAAFKHGFDAMVWAKSHEPKTTYPTMTSDLGERNKAYAQSHLAYRM